jgi:integral membrane protein (TIGR01906 family)
VSSKNVFFRVADPFLIILLPITIILSSVFIVLYSAGVWIPIEYRMPGFPEDRYGFDLEDRLYWSSVDIEFLLGNEDISYFDSYQLDDGSPMHNARELRHMEDVQVLLNTVRVVLLGGWILILLIAFIFWRTGRAEVLGMAVQRAGRVTLILIGVLVVGIVASFSVLFVGFHRIFFEGDSWLFAYSDTFIRLYPQRFWRDCFILLALVTVIEAYLVQRIGRYIVKRTSANMK